MQADVHGTIDDGRHRRAGAGRNSFNPHEGFYAAGPHSVRVPPFIPFHRFPYFQIPVLEAVQPYNADMRFNVRNSVQVALGAPDFSNPTIQRKTWFGPPEPQQVVLCVVRFCKGRGGTSQPCPLQVFVGRAFGLYQGQGWWGTMGLQS